MWGAIDWAVLVASSRVWPSAGALAVISAAMVLEAPGRFSITKLCLRLSLNRSASIRAMTSVPPPAEAPTMIRTGLDGQAWAPAMPGAAAKARMAAAAIRRAVAAAATAPRDRTCGRPAEPDVEAIMSLLLDAPESCAPA